MELQIVVDVSACIYGDVVEDVDGTVVVDVDETCVVGYMKINEHLFHSDWRNYGNNTEIIYYR